jgi:hypothetical protein
MPTMEYAVFLTRLALGMHDITAAGQIVHAVAPKYDSIPDHSGAYNVKDSPFLAFGDDATDDRAAIVAAIAAANGAPLRFPSGIYRISAPIVCTTPPVLIGAPGTRIKLIGSGSAVLSLDFSGIGWAYGPKIYDLILDGNGFATDGLFLKGVVSGVFVDVRVTNVLVAGMHAAWCQCCQFDRFVVSGNHEVFTTVPVQGILIDGAAMSSANMFLMAQIEGVSGAGIRGISMINTVFIGGTSEGHGIGTTDGVGVDLGEGVGGVGAAENNIFIGMDLEVNTGRDVRLQARAVGNTFVGMCAASPSPIQIVGARGNRFYSGSASGFVCDAASHDNEALQVQLRGVGATVVDAGTRNVFGVLYNPGEEQFVPDSGSILMNAAGTVTKRVRLNDAGDGLLFEDP